MKMHINDKLLFVVFGVAFWVLGTIFYGLRGHHVFESTSQRYWINFALTPILSAVICILLLKVRHVPAAGWASAALLIALPGMFGEAVLLSRFATFMPRMHPESAGKYGAFLFAAYALFLTIAEIVSLRA
jgi:ABC-type Co2+ transport system permease subunit